MNCGKQVKFAMEHVLALLDRTEYFEQCFVQGFAWPLSDSIFQ